MSNEYSYDYNVEGSTLTFFATVWADDKKEARATFRRLHKGAKNVRLVAERPMPRRQWEWAR